MFTGRNFLVGLGPLLVLVVLLQVLDGLREPLQGQAEPDAELQGQQVLPVGWFHASRSTKVPSGGVGAAPRRGRATCGSGPAHLSSSAGLEPTFFFFSFFFLLSISSWNDRALRSRSR